METRWLPRLAVALLVCACGGPAQEMDSELARSAARLELDSTVRSKRHRADADGNGWPDVGLVVTGTYDSLYAYDASGAWYWNLGDGRVLGSVGSVEELEAATLTRCVYRVHYRGRFQNTPFLDDGAIGNSINCRGYEHHTTHYLIVHRTDPRFTGEPARAEWGGDWEYHVLTESGGGNVFRRLRPYAPAGGD